jgi:uncharacterized OsmC-like protein
MDSSPEEKYLHDSRYHTLVDTMESHLHAFTFSPKEMIEIALMACIHYELHQPYHQENINIAEAYPDHVIKALDEIIKWRKSREEV